MGYLLALYGLNMYHGYHAAMGNVVLTNLMVHSATDCSMVVMAAGMAGLSLMGEDRIILHLILNFLLFVVFT